MKAENRTSQKFNLARQGHRIEAGSSRPCFFFEMSTYCVCQLRGETFDFCFYEGYFCQALLVKF